MTLTMKKGILVSAALLGATAVFLVSCRGHDGVQKAIPVIARVYFAGTNSICSDTDFSGDTNWAALENEFGSAEARALEGQTLDKLSRAPGLWFKDKLPGGAGDGSAQLRPLLDDFLKSEWIFEMRDTPATPEYALAIRLNTNRTQLWLNNLRSLLESWTKINARNIPGGWELKKDEPPNLFRIVRAGDWVVIGCGQDALPLSDAWSQEGIPQTDTNWLSANVDWPRLAQIFPVFARFDFPRIEMQVAGLEGNLKLTGKLDLSQPPPSLEKWQIPTNMIHQPLTSFTAVRGFAPWLKNQPWAKLLQLSPPLNQAFSWSQELSPLQTYIAAPVPNATNALAQLGQNLSTDTNLESHFITPFGIQRSARAITWQNIPFVQPEIEAMSGPSGDFLVADVFANSPRGKAPPRELLQALERNNLVFYHWEITSARLRDLPQLTQLALMFTRHKQLGQNDAASQWLNRIGPSLGNCVTEVTQTGPTELTFVRTAPAGLTAIELIALANWLEAPDFPGCDLSLHSNPMVAPHRHHKKLMAPAPPVTP